MNRRLKYIIFGCLFGWFLLAGCVNDAAPDMIKANLFIVNYELVNKGRLSVNCQVVDSNYLRPGKVIEVSFKNWMNDSKQFPPWPRARFGATLTEVGSWYEVDSIGSVFDF